MLGSRHRDAIPSHRHVRTGVLKIKVVVCKERNVPGCMCYCLYLLAPRMWPRMASSELVTVHSGWLCV